MAYWLIKSEPSSWSWDDQVKAGAKGTEWSGVRNHLAKKHLMTMKKGDVSKAEMARRMSTSRSAFSSPSNASAKAR